MTESHTPTAPEDLAELLRANDQNTPQVLYCGRRTEDGVTVMRQNTGGTEGQAFLLALRLDLRRHSPTGFEWGYGGSGPAQLALALLADALQNDERALTLYQRFKWEVVVRLPEDEWFLSDADIRLVVQRLQAEPSTPAVPTP